MHKIYDMATKRRHNSELLFTLEQLLAIQERYTSIFYIYFELQIVLCSTLI